MFSSRALLFACAVAWLACPASPQKVPDTRLDTAGTAWNPLVSGEGYSIYAIWEDFRSGSSDIYFNESTSGGNNWRGEFRVSRGVSRSWRPRMSTVGQHIYVAYNDRRSPTASQSDIYFNRSLSGGFSWLMSELKIDTAPAYTTSRDPQISSAGDNVYIVWEDFRAGFSDIYYSRSISAGLSFLPNDIRVNQNAAGATTCTLPQICSAGNNVYVVWEDDRNGNKDIYFNSSTDGGLTWLTGDRRLDTDVPGSAISQRSQIASNGNNVFVVWEDLRNGAADIYFNRSTDGGVTWLAADVRLDVDPTAGGQSNFPKIAVAGSNVYVVWQDFGAKDIYFQRSTNSGVTWLADDVRIDHGAPLDPSWQPSVACRADHVCVVWQDLRNGRTTPDIYFNRSTDYGTTWLSSDVRINTEPISTAKSETPEISMGAGNVYMVWADHRGGQQSIYFNIGFGFQHYGSGLAGSGGFVPRLTASGFPTLGSAFSLDVSDGLGSAMAALFGGTAKAAMPLFGGTILVTPALAPPFMLGGAPGTPGVGTASFNLWVPNDPGLLGADLYFQVLVADPGAIWGVAMSNGLEMWIG